MVLRKLIKSEAVVQVAAQAVAGGGVDALIFEQKSGSSLLCLFQIVLIENGAQFGIDLVMLFLGYVAQNVFHLVPDAPLAFGFQELTFNRLNHRFAAVGNPQIHLLQAALFQVCQ